MAKRRTLDQIQSVPTTLGRDGVFLGDLRGCDNYVVHGQVQGDGEIEGILMIGQDCYWRGNVTADVIIIRGRVEGNISAHTKLELRASARIKGDLTSPLIAVAEGALVQGRVSRDSVITRFTERRTH